VEELLKKHPSLTLIDKYNMTYDEWQGGTVAPFRAGGFLIEPPWHTEDERSLKAKKIILDPGLVFGTGTHPTTNDCLEALEIVFCRKDVKSVIDLGTGTGLLALAAAVLGCSKAIAVDFNLLAVKTARKNIELNGFEDRLMAVHGRAEDLISCPADLLVANIHYDVMKRLISSEEFLNKKMFIISGLLRSQALNVLSMLSQYPVKIIKKWEREGVWHTYLGAISI
jgi:ribosomal protein L11 methyltransferase